jgi:endogenous inhibitor of DNA gyrase (YacG/DUF329 family)
MENAKKLNVKCPKCKKAFNYYSSEFRPFCSERCKMIDLGHWMEETYTIPSTDRPTEEELMEKGKKDGDK